jgi:membrane protein YqaA with SNARE-associated domain
VTLDLAQLVSIYGVWIVAGFIALESVGLPLPAEAALIAAAVFAARSHTIDFWLLIATGIPAAIGGDIVGFWMGRTFGCQLLLRSGGPLGLTEQRVRIAKWLFYQYGSIFVFTARFLPFLRNIVAAAFLLVGSERPIQQLRVIQQLLSIPGRIPAGRCQTSRRGRTARRRARAEKRVGLVLEHAQGLSPILSLIDASCLRTGPQNRSRDLSVSCAPAAPVDLREQLHLVHKGDVIA